MTNRKNKYKPYTIEELEKFLEEAFKDYNDPTEGMTLGKMKEFDKAMKKEINRKYGNGDDIRSDIQG